jgi:hypothetical protein
MSMLPDEPLVEIACELFPAEVRREYAELLHQQAQGGAGKAKEICRRIADKLVTRKVTPRLALKLHLSTMEEVIGTMGADAYRRNPSPPSVPPPRRRTWFASGVN